MELQNNGLKLLNAQELKQESPDTFWAPELEELESLLPGDYVKICVETEPSCDNGHVTGERLWVTIVQVPDTPDGIFHGEFANSPVFFEANLNDPVEFFAHNVYDILEQQ